MEVKLLNAAAAMLNKAITEFPIGAKTPDDFKTVEDKIKTVKESLIRIKGRSLGLRAQIENQSNPNLPASELSLGNLNDTTANSLINKMTLELCIYSKAIEDIMLKKSGKPELQRKVALYLNKLFTQNNELLSMFEEKYDLMKKKYELQLKCQNALFEYKDYLNKQKEKRNLQLQENNPSVAHDKQKIQRSIMKINVMKKLITNLISAACERVIRDAEFLEILKEHRDIVNLERIIETAENMDSMADSR